MQPSILTIMFGINTAQMDWDHTMNVGLDCRIPLFQSLQLARQPLQMSSFEVKLACCTKMKSGRGTILAEGNAKHH